MTAPVRIRAEVSAADHDAARFTLDRDVAPEPQAFASVAEAAGAPLASALLALPGVRRVALHGPAIAVCKTPGADWAALKPAVAAAIRLALPLHDAVPPAPESARDDDARLFDAVRRALEGSANPAIARHGGRIDVVAVRDGDVMLRMSGGCQGCAASAATLRDGVERILRATAPGIRRIVDVTDHDAGRNPFFRGGGGRDEPGVSPLATAASTDALTLQDGVWTVDAAHLAARFGVTPQRLRAEMQAGRVASTQEVGVDADSGSTRVTVRWGRKLWRARVGPDGAVVEESGQPAIDTPTLPEDHDLSSRIRDHLMRAERAMLPVAYAVLAEALDLRPPHAIARVALALEATMREDAAADRPFIAALVIGRARGGIPAPGFFELAAELGRGPAPGQDLREFHARELARAIALRGD